MAAVKRNDDRNSAMASFQYALAVSLAPMIPNSGIRNMGNRDVTKIEMGARAHIRLINVRRQAPALARGRAEAIGGTTSHVADATTLGNDELGMETTRPQPTRSIL